MQLHMALIPIIICAICRSLPITVRDTETLDLSVISVLAVYLTQGAAAAGAIYLLSSFLTFTPTNENDKKFHHIIKLGLQKFFYNDATIIIAIILPALFIEAVTGWTPGNLSLPGVLIPTALFSILAFTINGVIQLTMFCLADMIQLPEMWRMLLGLTPNVIAAMPLGLLIAFGYSSSNNMWIVFIMLFPLLLARYAWKLYLDSEHERTRLITAFIHSLEAKDTYTQGHSSRVSDYSVQIAQELNLSRKQIQLIREGAMLHDIGKIGISDLILNKPGKLDDNEFAAIHNHPSIGVKILEETGLEHEVLDMVRSHHERYDGKGYPDGIPAGQLPIAPRILCVADSYDAMTSDRPYRKGMDQETALKILQECKGTQFDPEIVDAFVRSMEKK